jgi:hypothetical protein
MTDLIVNVRKAIHAPMKQVFDARLTAELLARSMLPAPSTQHAAARSGD